MGFPVTIQTQFGTLSAGLRTNHTARGKHARVETGRNMPGTPGQVPEYTQLCDIVSQPRKHHGNIWKLLGDCFHLPS